ncbi:hypothetical protein VPHG_00036 [Vibrio phage 11895-B1]|uniref:hypothetical protein n=1 Tax=Vibrio phage 11895-B1 TaxID=754075 RepID=UPI0002C0612F|nr:hypothetical protein VPHG_00036 [Vibrio phage 11895-B1]AGH32103.1 hypothetical protein VPHG_00036 [Vibrio phage 11895-B1]
MNIQNVILINRHCKGLEHILYNLLREWEFYDSRLVFNKKKNNVAKSLESKFFSYLFNNTDLKMFNTAEVKSFSRNNKRHYLIILSKS